MEPTFDKSYDLVMLNELYESDLDIYTKWKAKTLARWEGKEIPDEGGDAAESEPAADDGGDDGGDDDDDE